MTLFCALLKTALCSEDGVQYSEDGSTLIKGNPSFKKFTVPINVEFFKDGNENSNCFGACRQLEEIIFPVGSKLKIIGSFSFYKSPIKEIDLSACLELTEIRDSSFAQSKLVTANLPDSVQKFGREVFAYSSSLKPFIFPKNLTSILFWDFLGAKSFTEVRFKEGASITSFETESFFNAGVTSVHIPPSVTSIISPFMGCPLQEIVIDPNNSYFEFDSKAVISKNRIRLIFALNSITAYSCGNELRTICRNSFRNSPITNIYLNQGLSYIEGNAFYGSQLQSVVIPSSLITIEDDVFSETKIQTVTFETPSNLSSIHIYGFRSCTKLKRIVLPTGISSIGEGCFKGCSSLKYIWIPKTVTKLGGGLFDGVSKECNVTFEDGAPFQIENNTIYSENFSKINEYLDVSDNTEVTINSKTTTILTSAFANSNLKHVYIPKLNALSKIERNAFESSTLCSFTLGESVQILESSTFQNCIYLETINLSPAITQIKKKCFFGCVRLSSINILHNIKYLGEKAFEGALLETIEFEKNGLLDSIGDYCFKGIKAKTVSLPNNLIKIGFCCFENSEIHTIEFQKESLLENITEAAFCRCKSLVDIYLGDKVKTFDDSSFKECISLSSMTLPESVSIVQMRAFSGCTSLSSFKIPRGNLKTIYSTTFEGCTQLNTLTVSSLNHNYVSYDGCLFDYDSKKLILRLPAINENSFVVPSTIELIGMYAFQECVNLEEIIVNDICSEIGIFAFAGCENLVHLYLPDSVIKMGEGSLQGCTSLGCNGIVFNPNNIGIFVNTGVEKIAITPCPTSFFTVLDKKGISRELSGSLLFVEPESTNE